jgi:prevent-host-death family protein
MHITSISDAKAQLSALIEKVLAGEEIIMGKAGKPDFIHQSLSP